ncbi:N-succinylarginine dihydrolase [Parasphingorhabdus sp. JC815]|uniref:N-succinylarginine dihydrolase n=1 Tax=Parasphingorhabdus sp. JC815 TaxID=3232140 RepID=UPI00345B402C
MVQEINFDGIIGPSHNYAGLSFGNIASSTHAGQLSYPRQAALQGLAKMRHNINLGLAQGFFMPLDRPNSGWLNALGTGIDDAEAHIRAAAYSASSMWAANAATISPAPDSMDGKCHITPANLLSMPHRSHEWPDTMAQLKLAFANPDHFTVHAPVPPPFGDEGAANHMRLCTGHDGTGVEIFVYGKAGGPFPARQHVEASKAVVRKHGLPEDRVIFAEQSQQAIAAGAFHNDVVAVANERVLFAHEQAFAHRETFYAEVKQKFPQVEIITVPADKVSLADAIKSYLFNAQLITLPDNGGMALILPTEAKETAAVWSYLEQLVSGNGAIRKLYPVDVRQSMANGGGPACLRLRVVTDPKLVDPRFIATNKKLDIISGIIEKHWPETISPDQLVDDGLRKTVQNARRKLLEACSLLELQA